MSQSSVIPYKDLQREAKKCGIPANMKRQFLESALEAFAVNDQSRIKSIVDFHKSARKRRNIKPVKDASKSKNKKTKPNQNVVARLSEYIPQEGRLYDLTGDDDDGSNFVPDSTSTPMCQSLNNSQTDDHQANCSSAGAFSNLNYYEPPQHDSLTSYFKSAPVLMPRNPAQGLFGDDRNNLNSSYCNVPTSRAICSYGNSNYNFSHESYYPSQLPVNSRYHDSNALVPAVPEIGYERQAMMYPNPRNSAFLHRAVENECASPYLPNVPQLNNVVEKPSAVTLAWSQNVAFNGNTRGNEGSSNHANVVQDGFGDCFRNKGTDNGSISAEFDSNSDTESLSLPDEIANFFDSEIDNEKKLPSSFPVPFDYHPKPNVPPDILQSYDYGGRSAYTSNGNDRTASEIEKSQQDSGIGSLPLQTIMPGSDWSFDQHNLLPSIATLLPDYNMSAYCQAYMKPPNQSGDLGSTLNDYPSNQFMKCIDKTSCLTESRNTDDGSYRCDEYENYSKNYTIPYLTSNTSQQSTSMLKSYLGNKSLLPLNDSLSENSSVSSSAVEDLPSSSNLLNMLPFNVLNEAMQEMQNCKKSGSVESYENGFGTRNGTSRELVANQEGTRVIYQRQTISIQNTLIENNVKKDVYRKSLEIQMKKPAENIQVSTMCESTTQVYGGNLIRSSFRSCKNKMYGCVAVLRSNESLVRGHEKECIYQVVHCPLDKCDWCDIMKTLTAHVYESHKTDLRIGKDLVYVVNRPENEEIPFITYFQLYEGTVFVITLHINEKKCIATMQYIPELETTDYRNKRINAVMHLIYFASNEVESRCWEGEVQPYLENDETLFQKENTLQSTIGNSQNLILRVLIV